MRSTQVFTVLALLAASASGMSIGHPSNHDLVSRRHAAGVTRDSVLQARGARVRDMSDRHLEATKRESRVESFKRNVPRKRGINQRRCSPKTSTATLATSTTVPTSTAAPSADPTTTSESSTTTVESTTQAKLIKVSTKSKHATSTKTTAKATSTPTSGYSSGGTFTGEATFYGTGLGACGITNKDTDFIVAVSKLLYDGFEGFTGGNPNNNPVCGKKIIATYKGKSVTVTATDRCEACALHDLDFSPAAFDKLADEALGRLTGMTWKFV